MPIKPIAYVAVLTLSAMLTPVLGAMGVRASEPLSVIDWVQQNPDQPAITSVAMPRTEPAVAQSGQIPQVSVEPLKGDALRIIGLVPSRVTGLGEDIWRGSDPAELSARLLNLPEFQLPAAQALLYTVLLTETRGPGNDAAAEDLFTLARVSALQRFGALDPALALIEQAGVTRDKAHFATYMDVALLTGQEWAACNIIGAQLHLSPGMAHRIFCAARKGNWSTAALLFDTASALDVISKEETALLDRFLHPEYFEGLAPLRPPSPITPLLFRLHEAIGEPLTTRLLPRAYAVADLRDLAGWKAQLEAAERLAQSGALPENRLLGLYTERLPAASGGIWDRVEAIQQLDTALDTGSAKAVNKTLVNAWNAMQDAGLETAFAGILAERLQGLSLSGQAAQIAERLIYLSPLYRDARYPEVAPLVQAVATGDPSLITSDDLFGQAIIEGFKPDAADARLITMAKQGREGEVILRALALLQEGIEGDAGALRKGLGTLRALGFEETARRASLQILLLDRFG
ncbi:hypothetical protein ROLI_023560 [Roseobacter fucihabitans]|uniref:Uncharacterized protein n=1 Tax=Roseobacter fucihabitans TaxID=1537242 RepID=A0ABZ2BTB2_9RHOB|nr:hypothetical protein [Roseobacter litoralis]MBC6965768.1 hypothetical protein [Roseobacter litoralis]